MSSQWLGESFYLNECERIDLEIFVFPSEFQIRIRLMKFGYYWRIFAFPCCAGQCLAYNRDSIPND